MNLYEALKDWTGWLCTWYVVMLIIIKAIEISPWMRDDSDMQGWFAERSEMKPVIDHKTGCYYLRGQGGGLTPRLNPDGTHMCDPTKVNKS